MSMQETNWIHTAFRVFHSNIRKTFPNDFHEPSARKLFRLVMTGINQKHLVVGNVEFVVSDITGDEGITADFQRFIA